MKLLNAGVSALNSLVEVDGCGGNRVSAFTPITEAALEFSQDSQYKLDVLHQILPYSM